MTSLTPDEQHQVDTAVTNNCVCTEMDCAHSKSFRRGITFALQHLFAGRMEGLLTLLKKINDDAGTDLSMPLWEELERMINNYNKTDK